MSIDHRFANRLLEAMERLGLLSKTFTQLIIDSTAVDKIIETKDESSNQEPNNGWLKQFQDKAKDLL